MNIQNNAYTRVVNSRNGKRNLGGYYIKNIIDDFVELHGDRYFGDDLAILGGVGTLEGIPVTVVAMDRGETIEERMKRHFGCPTPEGYRKALRLMKQAEKFGRPIITFIGGSGAYPGIEAEERGQGEAIARNLFEMMGLKVPVISVLVGEGGSGGALALGVGDTVIMFENSIYSVISPEGCASILWKDSSRAAEAAQVLRLTADDLKELDVIEKIISETDKTDTEIAIELKKLLVSELNEKLNMSKEKLLSDRYNKFRKIGA